MFTKFNSQTYKTQNLDVKYLELQKCKSHQVMLENVKNQIFKVRKSKNLNCKDSRLKTC